MVYKYSRKTNQGSWNEADMKKAIQEAAHGSLNSIASKYSIPYATLYRHVKSGSSENKLGRFRTVFSKEQEDLLVEYLQTMDSLFYGLTRDEFKKLAFDFAEKNAVSHPFQNGRAGDEWLVGFMKRHSNLSLRSPEPTSIARARGFNRQQVTRLYDLLWQLIQKHQLEAYRIFNMDETGIQTSTNKPPKIMSTTGKKQVGIIASTERGRLTTAVCCCNAAGSFIPPFLIFARKRMQERLLDGAPPGCQASCTDNGWINGDVFHQWIQFFVEQVRPTQERNVLLVLDNHESHKNIRALDFAKENHVVLLSFAPHTTHKLQPLDIAVYEPLKSCFEQAICTFQKNHPGRIVNQYDIGKLFSSAYLRVASAQNAISGFRSSGIWPYNPDIFSDVDYAPASVKDNSEPTCVSDLRNSHSETVCFSAPEPVCQFRDSAPDVRCGQSDTASLLVALPTPCSSALSSSLQSETAKLGTSSDVRSPCQKNKSQSSYSPHDVRPLPVVCRPEGNKPRRKRKCQRSEILTSTPIRYEQREIFDKKGRKGTGKVKIKLNNRLSEEPARKTRRVSTPKFSCQVCEEPYTEPPEEDWIQCSQCTMWSHESCTSYSGHGSYFCVDCFD